MAVTIIGDAFIDIVVPIHGIKAGETYHRAISMSCGGTANVAIRVSRLGKEVGFVGVVGDDALGMSFVDNLKKNDVKALTSFDNSHPTGLCISLAHEDGERTMIASRGANDYLTRDRIHAYLDQIMESEIAYFSGYSLLNNLEVISDLMERCGRSCETWFNPGAPNIITDSFREVVNDLVDVLVLNLDEAKALTGKSEIGDIMGTLTSMVDLSVVSLEKEGCIVSMGEEWAQVGLDEVITGVDTTGAGDVFSAGFIVGRLEGMGEIKCARLANQTATSFLKEKGRLTL